MRHEVATDIWQEHPFHIRAVSYLPKRNANTIIVFRLIEFLIPIHRRFDCRMPLRFVFLAAMSDDVAGRQVLDRMSKKLGTGGMRGRGWRLRQMIQEP